MPCFHPLPAWRTREGGVTLDISKSIPSLTGELSAVRCGGCIGCRMARARDWVLRCRFELRDHPAACWSTLTYDDAHLPPTLERHHLQLFFRRFRKRSKLRFFACGEYGERTYRPHYHAILFGVPEGSPLVQASWPYGFAQTHTLSDSAIAYVAGYVAKKIGHAERKVDRVDPRTGEVYNYQPPFLQMSRRPGVGSSARSYFSSWRRSAVVDGSEVPVPRYLHAAWADRASPSDLAVLNREIQASTRLLDRSFERLEAGELIAFRGRELAVDRRSL